MGREILIRLGERSARFSFSKVTRSDLYGSRKRMALDPDGQPCTRASLTEDGSVLIQQGMLAQGYFDADGEPVASRDLVGLDTEGNVLPNHPSTLGVEVEAERVEPSVLLDLVLQSVYALTAEELPESLADELHAGTLLRVPFVYRTGTKQDHAILVANDTGIYALIGQPGEPSWCALDTPVLASNEDDDLDDDLDFEMF